ncbi:hypothetical protein MPTK1_2g13630 [Marchantia polymorpha subsp. ruderalis]|uniref:Uncharacterized protein n=1 Tax=Marchantia polymorpha TaxID=3197 RepID=A0A2R6XAI0_MARPO|nr:hypothetical protein MARPO_0026s0008 [Marchantia polymorpha]BBN02214.1 hypothetical protein Mp_2g13630 [Marchantia polymorpha subsp. ruderalis]|eukprot:PTQ43104.1 hypothetical protein MARPO_0026s0008 [Marchantia polymorpha]
METGGKEDGDGTCSTVLANGSNLANKDGCWWQAFEKIRKSLANNTSSRNKRIVVQPSIPILTHVTSAMSITAGVCSRAHHGNLETNNSRHAIHTLLAAHTSVPTFMLSNFGYGIKSRHNRRSSVVVKTYIFGPCVSSWNNFSLSN